MKKYNLVNNSLGWLCFVIAAVTYMLTLEPTASFWDCPEFILQGAKLEIGHPPGKAGKGKHLGIPAGGIACLRAKPALGFVTDQFGNHQNTVSLSLMNIPGDSPEDLIPVGRPVPAQEQMQHLAASFFLFFHHTTDPGL